MEEVHNQTTRQLADEGSELKQEIGALLNFCRSNTAVVAAGIVFLVGCSILSYSVSTDASVNVFSAEIIAAIPVIFSSLVVLSLTSLAFILAPTYLIFEGAHKDREGRLRPLLQPSNFHRGHRRRARRGTQRIVLAWWGLFSLPGLLLAVWAVAETLLDGIYDTGGWLLILALLTAASISIWLSGRMRRPCRHRSTAPSIETRVFSSVMQALVMMLLLMLTLDYATNEGLGTAATLSALFLAPAIASLTQMTLVTLISNLSGNKGFVRRSFFAVLIFVVAFCVIPPSSSLLLRKHFSDSAVANGACFRVAVAPEITFPAALIDHDFKSTDGQRWSAQLRAISPLEDTVQVRLKQSNGILYRVSKDVFGQTISCREEKRLSTAGK